MNRHSGHRDGDRVSWYLHHFNLFVCFVYWPGEEHAISTTPCSFPLEVGGRMGSGYAAPQNGKVVNGVPQTAWVSHHNNILKSRQILKRLLIRNKCVGQWAIKYCLTFLFGLAFSTVHNGITQRSTVGSGCMNHCCSKFSIAMTNEPGPGSFPPDAFVTASCM